MAGFRLERSEKQRGESSLVTVKEEGYEPSGKSYFYYAFFIDSFYRYT